MKLTLSSLSKSFHDADRNLVVIQDLSAEFLASNSYAIVGRSGVGKSTLLYMLGGLDSPSHGEVLYDKISLASLSPDELSRIRGEKVGFIFQFHHLLGEFTALENVAMPLTITGLSDSQSQKVASELLERVGLKDRISHRPGQLSGGEQQRVAIARALVRRPELILADEPTGNLDFQSAESIQKLLIGLAKDFGSILITVTHNQELASNMDHVLEMLPGGSLAQIRK